MIFVTTGTAANETKRESAQASIRPFHLEGLCGSYLNPAQARDWKPPGP